MWENTDMVKKVFKTIAIVIVVVLILVIAFFAYLAIGEYKPEDIEPLSVSTMGEDEYNLLGMAQAGKEYKAITWNCGYGALGDNADFFMDGGTMVYSADKERVEKNVSDMNRVLIEENADFIFLQEVDENSDRSYNESQTPKLLSGCGFLNYTFAYNFKVSLVPYPIPPIGKVASGILTATKYEIEGAERIQLPIPFKWPVRMANLKRCLSVHRIPVDPEDGDNIPGKRDLVLVNLHLEAYDDGEGKIAQTEMLKEFLVNEYEKGNYVIAGGDYNQTFNSVDSSMYPKQEGTWECGVLETEYFENEMAISDDASTDVILEWKFIMDNKVPSCRSLHAVYEGQDKNSFQYYLLDGFIVSPNVEVTSFETRDLGFIATDHNPVVMTFVLK